jgi:hypothetical protein
MIRLQFLGFATSTDLNQNDAQMMVRHDGAERRP